LNCFNLIRKLLHITPKDALSRAGLTTGRLFVIFEPFIAKVTFHCNILVIIKLHCPKWTGLYTRLTADTHLFVDAHYSSLISQDSLYRASIAARRSCAVVTVDGNVKRGFLNHPDQPRPYTEVMFLLACNLAGMATHAILLKDN
jgi:hypothetical protein